MEAVARALTDRMIRYFGFPEERRDLLAFGMTYLFLFVIDAGAVVLAGIAVGELGLTLVVAVTSAVFRAVTGGAHFSDPWTCAIFSAAIAAVLGRLATSLADVPLLWLVLVAAAVSAVAGVGIWMYAPVASPAKPISPEQRARLRRMAWFVLAGWLIAMGTVLQRGDSRFIAASALGLIWQVATLTPGGARFYLTIDWAVSTSRRG